MWAASGVSQSMDAFIWSSSDLEGIIAYLCMSALMQLFVSLRLIPLCSFAVHWPSITPYICVSWRLLMSVQVSVMPAR